MTSKTAKRDNREQCRRWREANPERYAEGIKKANDARRADPEKWAKKLEQSRLSNKKHAAKRREYDKSRDKLKVRARGIVRNRIWRGTMERQPCEICGESNSDAHHDDYSKPLNVRWLCRQHHKEVHNVKES